MINRNPGSNELTVLNQHLETVSSLLIHPRQDAAGKSEGIILEPIALVINVNVDPIIVPPVAILPDQEVENQQLLTQVEELSAELNDTTK